MTVEDRLRATTEAVTAVMRPVRPLDLSGAPSPGWADDRSSPEPGVSVRRGRGHRRWVRWGAPFAAAVVVTVLALVLVTLRQDQAARLHPAPAAGGTATSSTAAAAIPRYYVALADTRTAAHMEVVVGDDQTGRRVAVVAPAAGQNFYGVTAAADDRTFVVMNYANGPQLTTWYRLRFTPGAAHPTQLAKLPIAPVAAQATGLALSPDGRELAVMWRSATTATNEVTHLLVYSVSTGAVLHSWTTRPPTDSQVGFNPNSEALSWVDGDRSLDFRWAVTVPGHFKSDRITVRAIDVAGSGHDLLADSRPVVQLPPVVSTTKTTFSEPCASSLTAANGTVVCGAVVASDVSGQEACHPVPPSVVSYSGVTGRQLKVLYQYRGQCLNGAWELVWTNPTGSHVIAFLLLAEKGEKASAGNFFGVVFGGHFTRLPALPAPLDATSSAGSIAF